MAQYAQAFADNDIDFSVLRHLTDQHLKDLGVSLGHRLKMLQAIRDLADAAAAVTASAASAAPVATEPTRHDDAERRQLTVMFTDLVGSTALSIKLDPEDLRSVIGAYHRCVAETVARFDGFVAKYMGDGVLVYFGYPQAHEDDAERAVRAGLALIEDVGKLRTQEPLQVRIGVATGVVVVGEIVGSGEAQERGVIGETPNLAARLQGIAEPDTVVIADGTRRLVGNLFELQDLGTRNLKGIAATVRAWAAQQATSVESRFEALHLASLTPLIGREEEIELLLRRWQRAKHSEGQVVLLSGEPGIGKSRIATTLQERIANEPHIHLRYFCSPYDANIALRPFINQLERAAGFQRDDPAETKWNKLEALLSPTSSSAEQFALLAELLSLPPVERCPPLDLTPQRKKQKTLEALVGQFDRLVAQSPILMLFEDVHWLDPSSHELLETLVDRVKCVAALLVVTFRPEFQPPWIGQAHVTMLALNRLGPREGTALVKMVAGNTAALSTKLVAEIVDRTDGVPLFVEELTKAVVEADLTERRTQDALSKAPLPRLAIPATLHASLMACSLLSGPISRSDRSTRSINAFSSSQSAQSWL
jgi:class 3 adenylate cyclase